MPSSKWWLHMSQLSTFCNWSIVPIVVTFTDSVFVMQSGMAHTLVLCCNFFTHLGVYSLKCTPRLISSPQARQIQLVSYTPGASLWRRLTLLGFPFTECTQKLAFSLHNVHWVHFQSGWTWLALSALDFPFLRTGVWSVILKIDQYSILTRALT